VTRVAAWVVMFAVILAGCDRASLPESSEAAPAAAASGAAAVTSTHPLDPLTAEEITAAISAAKADARLATAVFPSITLQEPPKADVLTWQRGKALPRQARLQAMTEDAVFELVADVGTKTLVSIAERKGAEPSITTSEIQSLRLVLDNPEFRAGLQKRGITDLDKVFCAPFLAGYYGNTGEIGRRLVKVGCFDTRRTITNLFGWPIERLYALVDLRKREVLSVVDTGAVPIAPGDLNYTDTAAGASGERRKPTIFSQPAGANFHIEGHEVTWGKWRFHARVDPRVGTVISLARWQDAGGLRSVLYEGYLSEMFVPYMDAEPGWQSRTYFDTGEYGAGAAATPLVAGVDCPATAAFLPAVFGNEKGEPYTTPDAMCIFERSTGDPIWRHSEAINQTYEGRANVELVVRMAATIGNYDYLFDWIFSDAAALEVRVGATGLDALKGVASAHMRDATAAADTRYGTLVAPNLVAVHHDHYFNFRLDLDVDGTDNSFNEDVYRATTLPPASARRSIYVVERRLPDTEKDAQLDTGHGPSRLRVMNEGRTNGVGNPASYEVLVANHAELLLDAADWPAKRARFLAHDVWVTPYDPAERYAAGEYVLGSRGDDGLAVWAAKNRPIRNHDIVMWVNIGMHHLTRAEDLPVMPTIWHSFTLRPHNFFDRSPAADLRNDTVDRDGPTR
jgi:primary-amine oxidase